MFLLEKSSAHVWKTARHQLKKLQVPTKQADNIRKLIATPDHPPPEGVSEQGKPKAETSQIAKLTVMYLLEKSSAHVWKTARHQLKNCRYPPSKLTISAS